MHFKSVLLYQGIGTCCRSWKSPECWGRAELLQFSSADLKGTESIWPFAMALIEDDTWAQMWCKKGTFPHEVNRILKLGSCVLSDRTQIFFSKFSHLFLKLFYFFFLHSRLEYRPPSSSARDSKEEEENPEIFKSTAFWWNSYVFPGGLKVKWTFLLKFILERASDNTLFSVIWTLFINLNTMFPTFSFYMNINTL